MATSDLPSPWVVRCAPLVPPGAAVLDVACGGGRHTRLFAQAGHPVTAVDRDVSGLADLAGHPLVEVIQADLEADGPSALARIVAGRRSGPGGSGSGDSGSPGPGSGDSDSPGPGGSGSPGPGGFGAVVVTNYLHRPLLEDLVAAVGPEGVLIYETFAEGNEALGGRVKNPEYLLRHGELLDAVRGRLRVLAYEDLVLADPPRAVQHICAWRPWPAESADL